MIHAIRQQGSRRTIDLSVRSDPNPRISEWPMPGTDTSKALSGCLQKQKHKICDNFCDLPIDKCHYISVQRYVSGEHNYGRFLPENRWKTPVLDFLEWNEQKVLVSAAFNSERERVFQVGTVRNCVSKKSEAELLLLPARKQIYLDIPPPFI